MPPKKKMPLKNKNATDDSILALKKLQLPLSILPSPNWVWEDGISFSLLSRFVVCRDRFHKYAVQGMREQGKQQNALNFGTYFHKLLEISAKDQRASADTVIAKVTRSKSSIAKIKTIDRLIGNMVFQEYSKHYADVKYNYFDTETKFDVRYFVHGVGDVRLVGKIDQLIRKQQNAFYVKENKTKENINETLIEATIPENLQTMMYVICAGIHFKKPITGIVYDVIRKSKIRQKNDESDVEFVERLREDIHKRPGYYFYRWDYPLNTRAIENFRLTTFDPLLREFYLWWKSIESNPLNPWLDEKGQPNSRHYRRPFGVYDSLTNGEGDYFNVIIRNSYANVTFNNLPFAELTDEED
jgi:hypothetical protein